MNKARLRKAPEPFVRRLLMAPLRLITKAYTTLSLHTSAWFIGLTASWSEVTYQNLAERTMTNPIAYRCYRLISDTMSSVDIFAGRETEVEGAAIIEHAEHPFEMLLERPNPATPSYQAFVLKIIADLFFGGELFIYAPESPLSGPGAGLPTDDRGLRLISPWRVFRIERDRETAEPIKYHWIREDGRRVWTDAARIQHIALPDPRPPAAVEKTGRGFPIAEAIWQELQLMNSGNDWNKSIFENKGRMPGMFKYVGQGKLGEEQYRRTKEHIQQAYRSDSEAALPGLLTHDYDFVTGSMTQREADWLRGAQQYARWIAVGLGVDPSLIGDQGSRTLANMKVAVRALYTLTVLPLLDWLVDELNARYMYRYEGDVQLYIDREGIDALQEDRTEVVKRSVLARGGPIASLEEARQWAGLDAMPAGEVAPARSGQPQEQTRLDMLSEEQLFAYVKGLWTNGVS